MQGDRNAQIGEDASQNWKGTCGQYCNPETNKRGLRLLELAIYNNLNVANTYGPHKPSRRRTWHSPGGDYHNQIDYITVKQRFQSRVNIAKTRSFSGADIVSDYELVMTTFRLHLQRMKNEGNIRIRFSMEKLKDPNIAEIFQATIGGKFAPLLVYENQDTEIDALITSFKSAVTETAKTILGKHRPAKKPWVTDNILKLCDKRRELKQKKNTTEGAKLYREANQQVKKEREKQRRYGLKNNAKASKKTCRTTTTRKPASM